MRPPEPRSATPTRVAGIPATGARAVDECGVGGHRYLVVPVIPQIAGDVVVRVNVGIGGQRNPAAAFNPQTYRPDSGRPHLGGEFATTGATEVTSWPHRDGTFAAISSGRSGELRCASHTDIYRFSQESR